MNDLAKIEAANGSELVERSREAMRLMSNAFEAESSGKREQEMALAALEAAGFQGWMTTGELVQVAYRKDHVWQRVGVTK